MNDAVDFERRLRVYGLSIADYMALDEAQGHRCAICHKKRRKHDRRFAVDHNHVTGIVRGLLCGRCNYLIGYLHENVEMFQRAASYLLEPPAKRTFHTPRLHVNAPPSEDITV